MVCLTSAILDHLAPAPALAHPPTRLINSHKGHHGDHWSHPSYRVHNQKASLDKLTKAETNDRVLPDILFINTINMCVICFNFQCQYMPPSSSHFFETPHYVTISVPWSVRHNQVGQQLLRSDISQHYSSPGHFRHLIRVIRRNDMTNKNTNTKITTKTMTNTFRAIFETFDQSDKKTWPDQQKDNKNTPP